MWPGEVQSSLALRSSFTIFVKDMLHSATIHRSSFTIFVKDMLHSATIHKQTWWLLLSFAL